MGAGLDADFISDLFSAFGSVTVRRMFGGAGLFSGRTMFGLVSDGVIYFKTGEGTAAKFEREGCEPFRYQTKDGTRTLNTYWRMPDRLYDDPDELAGWARQALAIAQSGAPKRAAARPSRTKKRAQKKKRA